MGRKLPLTEWLNERLLAGDARLHGIRSLADVPYPRLSLADGRPSANGSFRPIPAIRNSFDCPESGGRIFWFDIRLRSLSYPPVLTVSGAFRALSILNAS